MFFISLCILHQCLLCLKSWIFIVFLFYRGTYLDRQTNKVGHASVGSVALPAVVRTGGQGRHHKTIIYDTSHSCKLSNNPSWSDTAIRNILKSCHFKVTLLYKTSGGHAILILMLNPCHQIHHVEVVCVCVCVFFVMKTNKDLLK